MLPDCHMHTPLCQHAVGAPSAYKAAARRRGISAITFTDHMPSPDGYDPSCRMTMAEWPSYRQLIHEQQTATAPQVFWGVEADYYEGAERFLRPWLAEQDLDLVIGSVHSLEGWSFDATTERQTWEQVDVSAVWRAYFETLGRFAELGLVDLIGHLDLPKKFGYRPSESVIAELAQPALDRIAAAGLAIEINTSGLRRPVREIYPSAQLLTLARARDIPICFGSDAHRPSEVGANFSEALQLARACGYTQAARFIARARGFYPLPESI